MSNLIEPGAKAVRHRMAGLQSIAYEHPADRASLNLLKAIPGMGSVVSKVVDALKDDQETRLLANNVLVTLQTLPTLHSCFQQACEILDLPAPYPKLFVAPGEPNAYTTGVDEPYVVITARAVDMLTPDELLFVLGHELGHVKAGHVKYHTLATWMIVMSQRAAVFSAGLSKLLAGMTYEPALLSWARRSEFTADRAGFLVCQCRDTAFRAMLKLAGFPQSLAQELRPESLLEQFRDYQKSLGGSWWIRLLDFKNHIGLDHPYWSVRAAELQTWIDTGEPSELQNADQATLEKLAARVARDPQMQTLVMSVIQALTSWATEQFDLSPVVAAHAARKLIYEHVIEDSSPMTSILRAELHLQKVGADEIQYELHLLIERDGKPILVRIVVPFDTAWEASPSEIRREFMKPGNREIARLLYSAA